MAEWLENNYELMERTLKSFKLKEYKNNYNEKCEWPIERCGIMGICGNSIPSQLSHLHSTKAAISLTLCYKHIEGIFNHYEQIKKEIWIESQKSVLEEQYKIEEELEQTGTIYYGKLPDGTYKYGKTKNLKNRIKQHNQTISYNGIQIITTHPGYTIAEKTLHSKFSHLKIGNIIEHVKPAIEFLNHIEFVKKHGYMPKEPLPLSQKLWWTKK